MISVDIAGTRFNLRAAAIIEHRGKVLLHRALSDDFWTLPGGRVEPGEHAAATVEREMREELDEQVACGPLLLLAENFFSYRGKPNHEIGLYFETRLAANSKLPLRASPFVVHDAGARLEFAWFRRDELPLLNVLPLAAKDLLLSEQRDLRHHVTRE
ncbi:NUDIX hydrolase [Chromobacterium sp. ASV23]|uniref:NUDIX hydrolase n=1 Tax=Chromobacterium sp. ASV23 TaxID=2795110 RepID=UPI0018ED0DBB|nr:NUDIX domain-containing protein [Chromobacterium sp. ASV23]